MASLEDLRNDHLPLWESLVLSSTTQSSYHIMANDPTIQALRSHSFSLNELQDFIKFSFGQVKPGVASSEDYRLAALAVILEDQYRTGHPKEEMVRYAEDFIIYFSANRFRELSLTHRICRHILTKSN